MRFLYVMDPLETMHPEKDTSYAFMRAAQALGHENLHCLPHHLYAQDGKVYATVSQATVSNSAPFASYGSRSEVALEELDAVVVRKDPPFDASYLYTTQLLDLVKDTTFVFNDPQGLRAANEKLYLLRFPEWSPKTIVTASLARMRSFLGSVGGHGVIKPLDGAGGRGVLRLVDGDLNTPSIMDLLSAEGSRLVMVQEYLPAVREGDKRVLLLDGCLLGAILRVPRHDDLRANIHVGGRVEACDLTDRERKLVSSVGPRLREAGLFFVGLDLIGERLTEVNVTSPTGIQELGRLTGTQPEVDVIRWLERTVLERRSAGS